MTRDLARTVTNDLIAAGYNVQAVADRQDNWTVVASSSSNPVDAKVAANFAANHGVNVTTSQASFT